MEKINKKIKKEIPVEETKEYKKLFADFKRQIGGNFKDGDKYAVDAAVKAKLIESRAYVKSFESELLSSAETNGIKYANPYLKIWRDSSDQLLRTLERLGLTPSSRKKIDGSAKPKTEMPTGRKKSKARSDQEMQADFERNYI